MKTQIRSKQEGKGHQESLRKAEETRRRREKLSKLIAESSEKEGEWRPKFGRA